MDFGGGLFNNGGRMTFELGTKIGIGYKFITKVRCPSCGNTYELESRNPEKFHCSNCRHLIDPSSNSTTIYKDGIKLEEITGFYEAFIAAFEKSDYVKALDLVNRHLQKLSRTSLNESNYHYCRAKVCLAMVLRETNQYQRARLIVKTIKLNDNEDSFLNVQKVMEFKLMVKSLFDVEI